MDNKLAPNETNKQASLHPVNSSNTHIITESSSLSPSNLPGGGSSGINAGTFYDALPNSKFGDINESRDPKKKRTDKGLSFGKFSSSGIQDIHNLDDDLDSKSSHVHGRRRRRREASKSVDINSQNFNHYPRKDLTRTVELIKLIELNATIDYSYCTKLQCTQGAGSKFHYIMPISKFMEHEYVTLQFR